MRGRTRRVTVVGTHGRASVVSKVTVSVVLTTVGYTSRFNGNGRTDRASLQPLLVPCVPTTVTRPMRPNKSLFVPRHFDALRGPWHHTSEEIEIASVENGNPSRRHKKIYRNFDLLLPKFHFILPNFYFGPPWGIFVCSVEIGDFLGRNLH